MKQSDLYITDMEARSGCQKFLKLPGQVAPVRINLPPGMKNGQQLVINNAQFYDKGGIIATMCSPKDLAALHIVRALLQGRKNGFPWFLLPLSALFSSPPHLRAGRADCLEHM